MNIKYFLLAIFSVFRKINCIVNDHYNTVLQITEDDNQVKKNEENEKENLILPIMYALKVNSFYNNDTLKLVLTVNKQLFNSSFNNYYNLIHMKIYSEDHLRNNIFECNSIYSKKLIEVIKQKANVIDSEFLKEKNQTSLSIVAKNKIRSKFTIENKENSSDKNSSCKSNILYISASDTNKSLQEMVAKIIQNEKHRQKVSHQTKNGSYLFRYTNYYIFCDKALGKISHHNLLNHLKIVENQKDHTNFTDCYTIIFYYENFNYSKNVIENFLEIINQPFMDVNKILYYSNFIICQGHVFF